MGMGGHVDSRKKEKDKGRWETLSCVYIFKPDLKQDAPRKVVNGSSQSSFCVGGNF